jgi:hypothetical protein
MRKGDLVFFQRRNASNPTLCRVVSVDPHRDIVSLSCVEDPTKGILCGKNDVIETNVMENLLMKISDIILQYREGALTDRECAAAIAHHATEMFPDLSISDIDRQMAHRPAFFITRAEMEQ